MVFVTSLRFSVCHAPRPERFSFKGDIGPSSKFEQVLCDGVWVDFDAVSQFFRRDGPFRGSA